MENIKEVFLLDDVNYNSYSNIVKPLLEDKDYKKIILYINSYGGDVDIGLSLIEVLTLLKKEIITVNLGYCCSMAHIIYLIGDMRLCLPSSQFMIHGSSYWQEAPKHITEVEKEVKRTIKSDNYLNSFITSRTKITKKELNNILKTKEDYYYNSNQAVINGTSHRIIRGLSLRTILKKN